MKEKLKELLNNAYCPYSNYQVSSCVITKDNKEFYGVNVENASYGATICAERNAINNAIASGYKRHDFKKLIVMVKSDKLAFPCFLCRQVITEFFDNDVVIELMNEQETKTYGMKDIIINPFSIEDLS